MADAPELLLRRAVAQLLHTWDLAKYQASGTLPEKAVKIDGDMPTAIKEFTFLSSPPSLAEGRADMVYRLQFYTVRTGGQGLVEKWANDLRLQLDQKEYVPNILGISWSWEFSRTYFDKDTQGRSGVAVTYYLRGRRQ